MISNNDQLYFTRENVLQLKLFGKRFKLNRYQNIDIRFTIQKRLRDNLFTIQMAAYFPVKKSRD